MAPAIPPTDGSAAASTTPLRTLFSGQPTDPSGCLVLRPSDDRYLDGAEQRVADVVARASDLSSLSDELDIAARGWAQRYHLSASRANLLRALRLPDSARALDVGAGCGAITRFLGERCAVVDALEPVAARASVARLRTRDLPAVEVFVGRVDDLPPQPSYDLVTCIGVFEYAAGGGAEPEPYQTFLDHIAAVLRPGGTLVLGIENRIGVKYLAGAPEDHSGRVWDFAEGYPRSGPARTFVRPVLEEMLSTAGSAANSFTHFPITSSPARCWRTSCSHKPRRWRHASQTFRAQTGSVCARMPSVSASCGIHWCWPALARTSPTPS